MAKFKEAFAAARKKLGAGKTFERNGKSYSTNLAEESKTSIKPKARPAAKMAATAKATGVAGVGNKRSPSNVRNLKEPVNTMEQKNIAALKSLFKGTGKGPAKAPNRADVFKKKKQ